MNDFAIDLVAWGVFAIGLALAFAIVVAAVKSWRGK